MMLGEIAVHRFVAGQRQTDTLGDEPVRFFGGIFADDGERDLPGLDVFQTFAARNQFAVWREDRRNADDVASSNSRISQSQLKARKPFPMFSDAFGEKYFLRDERHGAGVGASVKWAEKKFSAAVEK